MTAEDGASEVEGGGRRDVDTDKMCLGQSECNTKQRYLRATIICIPRRRHFLDSLAFPPPYFLLSPNVDVAPVILMSAEAPHARDLWTELSLSTCRSWPLLVACMRLTVCAPAQCDPAYPSLLSVISCCAAIHSRFRLSIIILKFIWGNQNYSVPWRLFIITPDGEGEGEGTGTGLLTRERVTRGAFLPRGLRLLVIGHLLRVRFSSSHQRDCLGTSTSFRSITTPYFNPAAHG